MTIDPAMMKALGVLATGRPSAFPASQPGRAELWASLLAAGGYSPGEVSSACSVLLLERRASEWIELGDLTARIRDARAARRREAEMARALPAPSEDARAQQRETDSARARAVRELVERGEVELNASEAETAQRIDAMVRGILASWRGRARG